MAASHRVRSAASSLCEDRLQLGEEGRWHAAPIERGADRGRLGTIAYEDRDVGRLQRTEAIVDDEAGTRVGEHRRDELGATIGEAPQQGVLVAFDRVVTDRDRGQRAVGRHERLAATARLDRHERQRSGPVRAEAERAVAAGLRVAEQAVHGRDELDRRTIVGRQPVVPTRGRGARVEVAVDVGAAKAVDRLLRVADQQHRGVPVVVRGAIDAVEDAVLQRRRVLELVDQRDRRLLDETTSQRVAARCRERAVEPFDLVREAEDAGPFLQRADAASDGTRGVQPHGRGCVDVAPRDGRERIDEFVERVEHRRRVERPALVQALGETRGCEASDVRPPRGPCGPLRGHRPTRSTSRSASRPSLAATANR